MLPASRSRKLPFFILLMISCTVPATAGEEVWQIDKFWRGPRKPMVDLTYGIASVRHRLFEGGIDDVGSFEVKLGYARSTSKNESIADLSDKYLFFNYSSADLFGRTPNAANVKAEITRFGFGGRGGFAYDFTSSYLYPYTQTSLQWTKMNTGRPAGLSASDAAILDRYEGTFRFSTSAEAGLAYGFAEVIAVRAGYEVTAIYPRHVFWPWVGSYGLAMAGMGAVSHFGEDIVETSPIVGPVVYTLLRAGVAYGYYLVVRDNQNWPFSSETPVTIDGFKFGVTLTF